jgi:hypothetical protein
MSWQRGNALLEFAEFGRVVACASSSPQYCLCNRKCLPFGPLGECRLKGVARIAAAILFKCDDTTAEPLLRRGACEVSHEVKLPSAKAAEEAVWKQYQGLPTGIARPLRGSAVS